LRHGGSMKLYVGVMLLMWAAAVNAAPKFDVAVGTETPIMTTIVPDNKDANLYYFFPTSYRISKHEGRLQFTYYETSNFLGVNGAFAAMTMSANFDQQSLDLKVKEIKAQNPNARFTPVTVLSSTIAQMSTLPSPTLEAVKCQPQGNLLGQDVGCELVIKVKNREVFIKIIRRNLSNVLALSYSFTAEVNGQMREITHALPIVFGEVGSGNYFFDGKGNPIPDPLMEEYKSLLSQKDAYYNKYLKVYDQDLPKLRTIREKCAGLKTAAECRAQLKGTGLEQRFEAVVKARPSDPYGEIQYEIREEEKAFSSPGWVKLLTRIEELKKELGIKN
jgi:hypothetical protein